MDIEEFRKYCLSLGDVSEKMPFGKFAARYDSILAFYVYGHMFCFIDIDNFTFVNVKSTSDEIEYIKERHVSVGNPINQSLKHWLQLNFDGDIPDTSIYTWVSNAPLRLSGINIPNQLHIKKMFQTQIIKKQLHFKQPAGTSRGVYTTRDVWYILLTDTGSRHYGVGECAPLPALSCDDIPSYDEVLATACKNLERTGNRPGSLASLSVHPVRYGNRPAAFPGTQPAILAHPVQQRQRGYPHQRTHLDGKL